MTVFPNWRQYAVHQRRPQTGCIPTGYEMLLRAAQMPGIDIDTFQDDFDLDRNLQPGQQPSNNFESVAAAVRQRYPHVCFIRRQFPQGSGWEKVRFIEDGLRQQRPVLVSLSVVHNNHHQGWHIMPVVDATSDTFVLLHHVDPDGSPVTCDVAKECVAWLHDNLPGGDDVAFLADQDSV